MNGIRLKCALKEAQLQDRLAYHPEILEFYLSEEDIFHPEIIEQHIRSCQQQGITVFLHHPMTYKGIFLDILSREKQMHSFYRYSTNILGELCRRTNVRVIQHTHYSDTISSVLSDENTKQTRVEVSKINDQFHEYILWENSCFGTFTYENPQLLTDIVAPLQLNMNFDVSHTFISHQGDNRKLISSLEQSLPYIKYFHVVDSLGLEHDSLPLGKGTIHWEPLLPFLKDKPYIFEIDLADYNNCREMIESASYLSNLISL